MSMQDKNTEENREKVLTKYDLKVQKREKAKKQAKREQLTGRIIGILVVVGLLCLVVSFPIRSYLTVNGTYIKVAGEDVSKVEFDYHYYTVKNNFITQYSAYMSMYGLDLTGDLSQMMYSESLTWKDYFEQLAVEDIINKKAMRDQAKAEGFSYDSTSDYAEYLANLEEGAKNNSMTQSDYVKELYGPLATISRIKSFVEENLMTTAYYQSVSDTKTPSEDEIKTYYEENKDDYDSVDYRLITVNAELPTEPTELADPVEETEETTGEEQAYQPSEAEIEAAMKVAKEEADKKLETVASEGELKENMQKSSISSQLRDWLFDAKRKAGDTTVIENTYGNLYYVVAFEKRYLDETPSVDVRVILTQDQDGQAIVDEWKSGAATEDSFAELADKYNDASLDLEGGYYEALVPMGMPDEMTDWTGEAGRKAGDVAFFTPEGDTYTYVVYFIGTNDAEWSINIQNKLLSENMTSYIEEISEGYEVKDTKGNLNYLKVQASLEEAEAEQEETETEQEETETEQEETETEQENAGSSDAE